tara:strand:+ start:133 stop:339 length:207 start_codon:yes stop_codon:yes gene_type:complete
MGFLAVIWTLFGFVICFALILGGGIAIFGDFLEKYNLPTILGTAFMILLVIASFWIFRFIFVLPIFEF